MWATNIIICVLQGCTQVFQHMQVFVRNSEKAMRNCSLSYVPLASKNSHIIQRIVPASLHTRLWLPVCPTTEQQNRCIKSFCCCNESSIKSWRYSQCDTEIIQGWNQNEMGSAQNINPTSYELFRLILMIAIVLAAFTIISASCNLLQLAWLQAWVPGCRIQLL